MSSSLSPADLSYPQQLTLQKYSSSPLSFFPQQRFICILKQDLFASRTSPAECVLQASWLLLIRVISTTCSHLHIPSVSRICFSNEVARVFPKQSIGMFISSSRIIPQNRARIQI